MDLVPSQCRMWVLRDVSGCVPVVSHACALAVFATQPLLRLSTAQAICSSRANQSYSGPEERAKHPHDTRQLPSRMLYPNPAQTAAGRTHCIPCLCSSIAPTSCQPPRVTHAKSLLRNTAQTCHTGPHSLRVRGTVFLEGSLWAAAGSAAASCRPLTPASHFCVQVRAHQSDSLHPRLLRHDPAV